MILKLDHEEAVTELIHREFKEHVADFPLQHRWQAWSSALQKLTDSKDTIGNLHYKPVLIHNGHCLRLKNRSTSGYESWHSMTLSKMIWCHLMLRMVICPSQAFAPNQVVIPKRDRMHVLVVTFAQEGIKYWFSKKAGNPNRTRKTGRMAANTKKDISLADQILRCLQNLIDLKFDLIYRCL